jgi:hypothetical protein
MRTLTTVTIVLLLTAVASAQASNDANKQAKVKEELQKLFADLNEATLKKDRAALERIYADEFQYIRPTGGVSNKTAHINGIVSNDPISSTPVATPSFDQLVVYGDIAVSRNTLRGTTISSIFVKKEGRWQALQVQGTRLAPERKPIKLDPQLLNSFLGRYEFGPGAIATVTIEGEALKWRGGNRMPVTLVPLSETHFYARETETEITFTKNEKGQVTDVVLRLGSCQDSKAKKIE